MPMRGGPCASVAVSPRDFQWDRATTATLRHSTLPWGEELKAAPLENVRLGARDRLSLLAQFAGHQAALRLAGIADGEVDVSNWKVVQQRGADTRLIRTAAGPPEPSTAPPVLSLTQQFAEAAGAPALDVFRESWGRAEAVFIESFARLRADAAADLRWARRAAAAALLSPGPDMLRTLGTGRFTYADAACIETLRAFGRRVYVVRGGTIVRYSALDELRVMLPNLDALSETEVVEQVAALGDQSAFVVIAPESLDIASRRVVQMLATVSGILTLSPDPDAPELPPTRRFVIAPTLAAARAAATCDVEALVAGPGFDAFLARGVLPPSSAVSLAEPVRSYLSVVALMGAEVRRTTVARLLLAFGSDVDVSELAVEGVTSLDETHLRFSNQRDLAALIAPASRTAICRVVAGVAAEEGEMKLAAALFAEAGETSRAVAILEKVSWRDDGEVIALLEPLAPAALSPALASRLTAALTAAGRYRDARDIAARLPGGESELALAQVERRTGDYLPALGRLERLSAGPAADLLRAEILSVLRREDEARALLEQSSATGDRALYLRALVCGHEALPDSPYLRARLHGYAALERNEIDAALLHFGEALENAECLTERIDAELDRVYTRFQAGRWREARAAALEALALVEETQGDRAAGGLLFLLAFLAADEGQWDHAAQRIARLRHYYGATNDARHLGELELLTAHLDFSRGRFDQAYRAASAMLGSTLDGPIAEAAASIVDEIDRLSGRAPQQRPEPQNAEFLARYRFARGGEPPEHPTRPQAFRIALLRGERPLAESIAAESGIVVDHRPSGRDVELSVLRALASTGFPPPAHAFEGGWRFAARNRLGHWTEWGSLEPVGRAALDEIAIAPPADWIACSGRELLHLEGCADWTADAREAVALAFRNAAELHRLRRLAEHQEPPERPRPSLAGGMLGESPAIREVVARLALVARRDVAVCILGESGTGKELAARAIHSGSQRRQKPFTAVNCAALPENLVESELFGHARGAFTGADRERAGLIETSDGGTLFLDEIGEMPLIAQAKLLRFLQEGEFRRVGDTAVRSADVRIVTATNRKLDAAVEQGRFREDLYYRIAGVEVVLPPLRDRSSDILLLGAHFLAAERERHRSGPSCLSEEVETVFLSYAWPGNVRELQNTIRAAHAVAGDAVEIALEHLPERLRGVKVGRSLAGSYQDAVARFRRDLIENALAQVNGNQNRAAAMLRISRQALGYQIRELGIMTEKSQRSARL